MAGNAAILLLGALVWGHSNEPNKAAAEEALAAQPYMEALQKQVASLLLPGESILETATETIEKSLDDTTSSWDGYAKPEKETEQKSVRSRVVLRNAGSGQQRTITCKPQKPEDEPEITHPGMPKPEDGSAYKISSKDVQTQIKNARPDTFYIDPQDYKKLGLLVGVGTVKIGTQKTYRSINLIVPTPGQNTGCGPKFTASWWDKGLRGWLVTELPKQAEAIQVSFNYITMNYVPEFPGKSELTVSPMFSTRKGNIETLDVGVLNTQKLQCGAALKEFKKTYTVPEGATHFTIRPGFSGKDKGSLTIYNIKITTGKPDVSTPEKPPIPGGDETVEGNAALESEVFALVNAERASAGFHPLVENQDLIRAARYHAQDMSEDGYFDHDSYDRKDGNLVRVSDPFTRIGRFYSQPSAENIAKGQTKAKQVMTDWMNSPGHRKNILSPTSKTLGVGMVDNHWVQNFGY